MDELWHVYCDEFERDNIFVYTGAIIPAGQASSLKSSWQKLQFEIMDILLREHPNASNHSKLQGNSLPEIHAYPLFNSEEYYRKYPKGQEPEEDKQYYRKHHFWLEKALDLMIRHQVRFTWRTETTGKKLAKSIKRELSSFARFTAEKSGRSVDISDEKLQQIARKPIPQGLAHVLLRAWLLVNHNDGYGEVVCDRHDILPSFNRIGYFETFTGDSRGHRFTLPRFRESVDEPFLQVSDVLSFIIGNIEYSRLKGSKLKEPLNTWYKKYIYKRMTLDTLYSLRNELSKEEFWKLVVSEEVQAISHIAMFCIPNVDDAKEVVESVQLFGTMTQLNDMDELNLPVPNIKQMWGW